MPYLKIVDDEMQAKCLKQLVEFDFKPGNSDSFKAFDQAYNWCIDKRGTVELQNDYQELLQLQAEHYTKVQKGHKIKENFYNCLKYLFKKNSLKAFNDEVIRHLDFAFEPGFHPNELLDEEMKEYREWKEKSEPFNFLSTYCELLFGIKDGNNPVINASIKKIFTELHVPLQYKIKTIQTIWNDILSEHVSVSHDSILKMIIEFEKYESRRPCLTNKFFKKCLTTEEKDLIRYALNEALSASLISG